MSLKKVRCTLCSIDEFIRKFCSFIVLLFDTMQQILNTIIRPKCIEVMGMMSRCGYLILPETTDTAMICLRSCIDSCLIVWRGLKKDTTTDVAPQSSLSTQSPKHS